MLGTFPGPQATVARPGQVLLSGGEQQVCWLLPVAGGGDRCCSSSTNRPLSAPTLIFIEDGQLGKYLATRVTG